MSEERCSTEHHVIPKSRGGKRRKSNKKKKFWDDHKAFHDLFWIRNKSKKINLLPCEAINIIKTTWATESGELDKSKLTEKQIEAWKDLFKNFSLKKAIQIIKQEWTLERCFEFKECFDFSDPKKKCPLLKIM